MKMFLMEIFLIFKQIVTPRLGGEMSLALSISLSELCKKNCVFTARAMNPFFFFCQILHIGLLYVYIHVCSYIPAVGGTDIDQIRIRP